MKEYGGDNRKKDDEGSMQLENVKEDGNTDNDSTDIGNESLGEKCDMHMIPWLTCVQSYRNAYTLITNKFYQTEFIDEVEKGVKDDDKIKFVYAAEKVGDGNDKDSTRLDPNSFLDLSDWFDRRQNTDSTDDKGSSDDEDLDTDNSADNGDSAGDDVDLVPVSATINVIDPGTGWEIDIAYVRDQDGSVLGFEQFTTLKRERREAIQYMEQKSKPNQETQEGDGRETKFPASIRNTGKCSFHLNPEKTKSVQLFALYKSSDNKAMTNEKDSSKDNEDVEKKTLYYSSEIELAKIEAPRE